MIVLGLAGYEYFTGREYRIAPVVLLLIGLVLAARSAIQIQIKKRAALLQAVPPKPLGLDD